MSTPLSKFQPNLNTDYITLPVHSKHPLCRCDFWYQVWSATMVYIQLNGQEQSKTRNVRYKKWHHNYTSIHNGTPKTQQRQLNGQEQCKKKVRAKGGIITLDLYTIGHVSHWDSTRSTKATTASTNESVIRTGGRNIHLAMDKWLQYRKNAQNNKRKNATHTKQIGAWLWPNTEHLSNDAPAQHGDQHRAQPYTTSTMTSKIRC